MVLLFRLFQHNLSLSLSVNLSPYIASDKWPFLFALWKVCINTLMLMYFWPPTLSKTKNALQPIEDWTQDSWSSQLDVLSSVTVCLYLDLCCSLLVFSSQSLKKLDQYILDIIFLCDYIENTALTRSIAKLISLLYNIIHELGWCWQNS